MRHEETINEVKEIIKSIYYSSSIVDTVFMTEGNETVVDYLTGMAMKFGATLEEMEAYINEVNS